MSLSARIALDPSRCVAIAERVVPSVGFGLAMVTLATRWPAAIAAVLPLVALAGLLVARTWGLRMPMNPYRLALSDRAEFGAELPDGTSIDARLVESTVAWPGFWMIAFAGRESPRVTRFAVLPAETHPDTRRSLSRYLVWATRAAGADDGTEIPLR